MRVLQNMSTWGDEDRLARTVVRGDAAVVEDMTCSFRRPIWFFTNETLVPQIHDVVHESRSGNGRSVDELVTDSSLRDSRLRIGLSRKRQAIDVSISVGVAVVEPAVASDTDGSARTGAQEYFGVRLRVSLGGLRVSMGGWD